MPLEPQHELLRRVLERVGDDPRFAGVTVTGSLAADAADADEYSDVDLALAVHDEHYDAVLNGRLALIADWVPLVAGFTGEHVGEPRVIITLVGPPPVHVDFLFVRASEVDSALHRGPFDPQWVEDRFWVWVHYAATKLGRGELFEVLDFLAFLRGAALGPLAALQAGASPRGVRRLERVAPAEALALRATVGGYELDSAAAAVRASIDLYRRWRPASVDRNTLAETVAVAYLDQVVPDR